MTRSARIAAWLRRRIDGRRGPIFHGSSGHRERRRRRTRRVAVRWVAVLVAVVVVSMALVLVAGLVTSIAPTAR